MPDSRSHRGAGPQDERLFGGEQIPLLRSAAADLSWLLSRGYADRSALKMVGDRYRLEARQRLAVLRSACSDEQLEGRERSRMPAEGLMGRRVLVDGFNLLITLESALGGAFLFRGRDGCIRDLAGLHGTYRIVSETPEAIRLLGEGLAAFRSAEVHVLLDRPVSNSGRLKQLVEGLAAEQGWPWTVELHGQPDSVLRRSGEPVITADSAVLDGCNAWVNLTPILVKETLGVRIVGLGGF